MLGLPGNMKPERTGWIKMEHMVKQAKIQLYSTQNLQLARVSQGWPNVAATS